MWLVNMMKNIYMMWLENPRFDREYKVSIDPKYCLVSKEEAKEHIEEYNDTHADRYRYYHVPKLWQRTRKDGSEESISDIERFMKSYYMHYDKFHIESFGESNEVIDNFKDVAGSKLFKKQYYDTITFIKEEIKGRIKSISLHRDDMGGDKLTIIFTDADDKQYEIKLIRTDMV